MANICSASTSGVIAVVNKTSSCFAPFTFSIVALVTKTYIEPAVFSNSITPALVKTFKEPTIAYILPASNRPTTGQFWPRQVTQRTVATTNTTSSNTLSFAATYGAF